MTRVLQTADTHLGYSQYHSETRAADFAAAFETLIDEAIECDVDAVVHSGDLFHHSRPDVATLAATLDQLQRLDEAGIPFLGIVGNHEGTSSEQWVDIFGQLKLGIRLDTSPTVVGDTAFYGLDHVSPARRPSLDYDFDEHDAECAVLVAHGLFSPVADGGRWNLKEVIDASNIKFEGFLLGDDHMPHVQTVRGATVTYPGSTDRTASDQRAPRGFNFVTTGAAAETTTTATDGGSTPPTGIAPDGPQPSSDEGWPSNITSTREEGVEQAVEGTHGESPVLVNRCEMQTRPFRYINITMEEGDGTGHVRDEIDQCELTGAVAIIRLSGAGEPILEAPLEEYARESGAMIARVDDARAFGSNEDTEDISFADPGVAIEKRLQEMDLSVAGHDIEEEIRNGETSTSSMADDVEDEIRERIDEKEDDFIPVKSSDVTESESKSSDGDNRTSENEGGESDDSDETPGDIDDYETVSAPNDGEGSKTGTDIGEGADEAQSNGEQTKDDTGTGPEDDYETEVTETEKSAVDEGDSSPVDENAKVSADADDNDKREQVTLTDRWS